MRYKVIVCAIVAAMLMIVTGCDQRSDRLQMKKSASTPGMNKKSSSDTTDIFKEFYSDDTTGLEGSKKGSSKTASKSHTFSPSSSVSQSASVSSSSSPSSSFKGEFVDNGRYVVQVSCVKSKSFAEKMVANLKKKNFPAYVAEVQNPTPVLSGTYYRIRIGSFSGYSSAKSFGTSSLMQAGYEYWVDKKSNDNTGMEGYGLGSGIPQASPSQLPSSSWSSAPGEASPVPTPSTSSGAPPASTSPAGAVPVTPPPLKKPGAITVPPYRTTTPTPSSSVPGKAASGSGSENTTQLNEWGNDSAASSGW
jgi:cell division septation protein DedD